MRLHTAASETRDVGFPQTSTNTGLFMTKINRKSCCRSLDEGEKSHIDLDNQDSVGICSRAILQFKHCNKRLLTFELYWVFKMRLLLGDAALWAISIHLTELHRVRVDRVGVSRLPANQSGFWTAAALPLLDHRRRRHWAQNATTPVEICQHIKVTTQKLTHPRIGA